MYSKLINSQHDIAGCLYQLNGQLCIHATTFVIDLCLIGIWPSLMEDCLQSVL